jgi:hypothetical protein
VAGELKRAFVAFEKNLTTDARKHWRSGKYDIGIDAAYSRDANEPVVVNSTTSATFRIAPLLQGGNEDDKR